MFKWELAHRFVAMPYLLLTLMKHRTMFVGWICSTAGKGRCTPWKPWRIFQTVRKGYENGMSCRWCVLYNPFIALSSRHLGSLTVHVWSQMTFMKDAVHRPEPDRERGAMSKLVSKKKRRSSSDDSSEDSSSSSSEAPFKHSKKRNKSKKKKRKHSKVCTHIKTS